MNYRDRLHSLHRFWRYRLSTERESIRYIQSLDLSGTTVFDLGANKGAYTYWLSKAVGFTGQVIALEPQPELIQPLTDITTTFKLQNVEVINRAASDEVTQLMMSRRYPGHGGARIIDTDRGLQVDSIRVDSFFPQLKSPVSFIKCDVEGHEFEALHGAEQILRMYQPIIQVEVHHEAALQGKVFRFLEAIGYTGWFFIEKHKIPIGKLDKYPYPRSDNHRNYFFSVQPQE